MSKKQANPTDIFNYKSKELYINLDPKDIPPVYHKDRESFELEEIRKCEEGVTINGVYLPGSFYYDINHHAIAIDTKDNQGKPRRIISKPQIRDIGWIIHSEYSEAVKSNKAYCLAGLRQGGKTDIMVSLVCRELFIYENSEVMCLYLTKADKETSAKKLDLAIKHSTDFIVVPPIDKDWKKTDFRFGFTKSDNTTEIWSKLFMYLTNEGSNSEIGAGKSLTAFFYDEIGKDDFRESWEAIKPAIYSEYGFRCSAYFAFTAGDIEKLKPAEDFFKKPESNNLLTFEYDGIKTGKFLDATYRPDFKEMTTFGEYVQTEKGIILPKDSELFTLPMKARNVEKANETLDKEEEVYSKDNNQIGLRKHKMYYPRSLADMFQTVGGDPFSNIRQEMKIYLDELIQNPVGKAIDLSYDTNGKVKFNFSSKPIIDEYPLKNQWKADAAFVIYDHPRFNSKERLYLIGVDPFNVGGITSSDSLGAAYVMRKRTSDYSDPFSECIVAQIVARPNLPKDFFKKVEMLSDYYDATILHEASTDHMTEYFTDTVRKKYRLEPTYTLNKEINPNNNGGIGYGMKPLVRTQEHYLGLVVEYCSEDLPNGQKGFRRIKDPMLIKELIEWEKDKNADRYIAFGHALMALKKNEKYVPQIMEEIKEEKKINYSRNFFDVAPKTYNFEEENYSKGFF